MNNCRMIFYFVLLSFSLVHSAHIQKRAYKIFRGDRITDWATNPFKFLGMLAGRSVCTASLYDSYSFVTAAHCFSNPDAMPTFVALEHTTRSGPIQKSTDISEYFLLPLYEQTEELSGNDVAVVKIKKPVVTPTYDYTTLPLLTKGRPSPGQVVTIVGYGLDTSSVTDGQAANLRQGQAKVQKCTRSTSTYPGNPICVEPQSEFNEQRTECGDSGSPLVYRLNGKLVGAGFLSGLASWTDGFKLIIFSSASQHIDFIKSHVGDNSQ